MIARNDLAHFILGEQMIFGGDGLVVNEGDGVVFVVVPFEGKSLCIT